MDKLQAKIADLPSFLVLHRETLPLIEELSQLMMEGQPSDHDWSHIQRVVKQARAIYQDMAVRGCSLVLAVAFVHDAWDKKLTFCPKLLSLRDAVIDKFADSSTITKIAQSVSWSQDNHKLWPPEHSVVLSIVQEADWIDASGPVGIARCFSYGARLGRPLTETIHHFRDKLLLMHHKAVTPLGRKKLCKLYKMLATFYTSFLDQSCTMIPS